MKKESIVEFDLDVYGWIKERERVIGEIEQHIRALFTLHKRSTGDMRRTGCFHVELSLPEIERSQDYCPKCGGKVVSTAHGEYCPKPTCKWGWEVEMDGSPLKTAVLNAVKSQGYYCCTAPFGEHEISCKNYIQMCTRDHICVLASSGPCNGFPREK